MSRYKLNCDMGEGFGLYRMGDDEGIIPHVHQANVACGFHASDPLTMARTVALAKRAGVAVGAHPSLPDREGFGRREMHLSSEELTAAFVYQIGALAGFLRAEGMRLSHVKPHGIIYGMMARDAGTAGAVARAVKVFDVPLFGMAGTHHETAARASGVPFVGEFFGDLEYDAAGRLIITREHPPVDVARAADRLRRAIREGSVAATDGTSVPMSFETVCIHSDTPNAAELATALRAVLDAA